MHTFFVTSLRCARSEVYNIYLRITKFEVKNLRKQDYLLMVTGHSLALQAQYKPEILQEFADHVVREIAEGYLEVSDVLEDVCDAYEKLGYMSYAKKIIEELNPKIPYFALVVQYHVSNLLFHCKAFLDAISNAIHHAFDLDIKKAVDIDITRPEFNRKLAKKSPQMADRIKRFSDWAKYIVNYRMALIHRYRFFSFSKDITFTKLEILREPIRPLNFFDKEHLDTFSDELKRKYGSSTIQVDDFCKEHLSDARKLFETIISEFLEEIRRKGASIFGWERIQPAHIHVHE